MTMFRAFGVSDRSSLAIATNFGIRGFGSRDSTMRCYFPVGRRYQFDLGFGIGVLKDLPMRPMNVLHPLDFVCAHKPERKGNLRRESALRHSGCEACSCRCTASAY